MAGETHPSFASDVMVEAEAEVAYNAGDVLGFVGQQQAAQEGARRGRVRS